RREWMLATERHRVDTGNVKLAKQRDHATTDECYVEITGAWTVGIERLVRSPLVPGHGAAAKNHRNALRRRLAQYPHKLVEASRVAAEYEPHYTLADPASAGIIDG